MIHIISCLESDFVVLFWPVLERRAIDGDSESGAPLGLGTESLLWVDIASEISHHCISVYVVLHFALGLQSEEKHANLS